MDCKLDNIYFDIMMDILGISKRDLKEVSYKVYEDDTILDFAKGINKHGVQESINILEKYVYSAAQIKKTIENIEVLEVV